MIATREALAQHRACRSGARVAVQGFGNVGSVAADLMAKEGAHDRRRVGQDRRRVTTRRGSDIAGPADVDAQQHRQLRGYPKGEPMTNEQLLTLDCDVLVPGRHRRT